MQLDLLSNSMNRDHRHNTKSYLRSYNGESSLYMSQVSCHMLRVQNCWLHCLRMAGTQKIQIQGWLGMIIKLHCNSFVLSSLTSHLNVKSFYILLFYQCHLTFLPISHDVPYLVFTALHLSTADHT